MLANRRARGFLPLAIGVVFAVAALAASKWISPYAGWAVIGLVLAIAYVRARRSMSKGVRPPSEPDED